MPKQKVPSAPHLNSPQKNSLCLQEIADNDAEQRKNLEEVGRGMETIKEMLLHMQQEVNAQVKGIDQLNGRMYEIKGQLVSAQRQAKQIET